MVEGAGRTRLNWVRGWVIGSGSVEGWVVDSEWAAGMG
jgi:hypothetical protein